jgi:uncharacterized protein YgiM (DUF1202 family)
MRRIKSRIGLIIALLAAVLVSTAPAAVADTSILLHVTADSAYARKEPCWSADKVASVFARQELPITGRTFDNMWLRVTMRGKPGVGWVAASIGTVDGDLDAIPTFAGCGQAIPVNTPEPGPASTSLAPTPTATIIPNGVRLKFTVTVASTYAREQPDWKAKKVASLLKKQTVVAIGRNTDGKWLLIEYAGAKTQVWVAANVGTLEGDLTRLPVLFGTTVPFEQFVTVTPTVPPKAQTLDPAFKMVDSGSLTVNIGTTAHPVPFDVPYNIRKIYQLGLQMGNRPDVFSKVGDCESAGVGFLRAFGYNLYRYDLGEYGYLQAVIDRYDSTSPRRDTDNSFTYVGVAAHNGFTVWSVLDPRWADRKVCSKDETPLACEYRLVKPGVAIIMLGSADLHVMDMQQFQTGLRHILIYTINSGTVPILSTFPGHPARYDQTKAFNWTMTELAREYGVPVVDLWQALDYLPNRGMVGDGFHMTTPPNDDLAGVFSLENLDNYGMTVRNLTSLQALEAVWRVLESP